MCFNTTVTNFTRRVFTLHETQDDDAQTAAPTRCVSARVCKVLRVCVWQQQQVAVVSSCCFLQFLDQTTAEKLLSAPTEASRAIDALRLNGRGLNLCVSVCTRVCAGVFKAPAAEANRLHTHTRSKHTLIKHIKHAIARSFEQTRTHLSRAVERVRESVRLHPGLCHRGLSLHQLRHHHHHTLTHTRTHTRT